MFLCERCAFTAKRACSGPAHVNPDNGYRHYDPRQLAQLHQIHVLKDMGFSLLEIRQLLRRRLTAGQLRTLFRESRTALLTKMQEDAGRLARIDARLRALEGKPSGASPEVLLRRTHRVWVVSLREK